MKKSIYKFYLMIMAAFTAVLCVFLLSSCGSDNIKPSDDNNISADNGQNDNNQDLGHQYMQVTKDKDEIYSGQLILVNNNNMYKFPGNEELVNVYEQRNGYYQFRDVDILLDKTAAEAFNKMMEAFYKVTELKTINLISGHRTYEFQGNLYAKRVASDGEEETKGWVALPGGSEHHTGYALDLGIFENGQSGTFRGEGDYEWVNANCYKFGYILRYDEAKKDITGINYEPWHFRYIGAPHAEAVTKSGLCYEEYIDFLKSYSYENPYSFTDENGDKYLIYYSECSSDSVTINVESGKDYKISGNGCDGFIITVRQ